MKILSGLLILSVAIIAGCSGTNSSTQTGTLIEPTVKMNSDSGAKFGGGAASKSLDIQTNLPFELWTSFEIKKFSVSRGSWAASKEEFCVISSTGSQLKAGEKVEIIDEARCLNTQYDKGDGSPFRRFPIGLIKIRVISTGEEGWTWSKSVEYDK